LTAIGVAHLEGVTSCPENLLWPRWCHPPIPTGRNDRGGGDIEGGGTVEAWRPWVMAFHVFFLNQSSKNGCGSNGRVKQSPPRSCDGFEGA